MNTQAPSAAPEPTPDAAPTATPKAGPGRWVTPVLALVAAVGVGLFGGVLIGQNTASASTSGGFTPPDGAGFPGGEFPGAGGQPGAGGLGGVTSGTITGIDGDTVTLELAEGSTVTVTASSTTTVTTTSDAAVSDLATGDTVTVFGEADDKGNVASATSISEGATLGGFGGFGGGRGGAPASDSQ